MSKVYIIKIGGNVIDNPVATQKFLSDFASIKESKILVHGGGKIATQVAEKLGVTTQMIDGRRITDEPMLDVVTMVYGGLVNKKVVAQLQALKCNAIGLMGADAGVILAKKRPVGVIDYGFAGDIEQVNATQLLAFINQELTPIIAPLTVDVQGQILNTNADTMASAIATALAKAGTEVNLVYCFEKKGVLLNPEDDDSVITDINKEKYAQLKADGVVSKGMIPKLDNAFAALDQGVKEVHIIHADNVHAQTGTKLTL
ncbi:acetylglutamate kinase [Cytophagaceae bacterium YF14B1]|uniref:Acetylglutamate kinase n=1 Tax=Xanthocytophaga flava TaxID=3048013 RepID=A0AAE3U8Q4_9BACT|nr:acetylglutamate kinase [Xanthocytophaga flavus]MDJ1481428.1 acetylglutamate kinase [Xanthocytophaga flavus]